MSDCHMVLGHPFHEKLGKYSGRIWGRLILNKSKAKEIGRPQHRMALMRGLLLCEPRN